MSFPKRTSLLTSQRTSPLVFCVGDSLTLGYLASSSANTYPARIASLNSTYEVRNLGVSGETTVQMLARATAEVKPFINGRQKVIVIVWGGTNDVYVDGVSSGTLWTRYSALCNAYRNLGAQVVAMPIIPRSEFNSGMRAVAAAFNTQLGTDYATIATALCPLTSVSQFSNPLVTTGTYWNADGVHLTDTGYTTGVGDTVQTTLAAMAEQDTQYPRDAFFSATLVNNQTIATATITKVLWDSNENKSPYFDSYKFTAPSNGVYDLHAVVRWFFAGSCSMNIYLYKNGSMIRESYASHTGSARRTQEISAKVWADAGDYFEIYVDQNSGADVLLQALNTMMWFQGNRI